MILTILGILISVLSTFFVAKYYFRKSVRETKLTPYFFFAEEVYLLGEEEINSELKILYQNQVLSNLYQLQFIIANTGDIPIENCISPLLFSIPDYANLIDYKLTHINPQGRKINIASLNNNNIAFQFELLNPGEYFIFNLLLNEREEEKQNDENIFSLINEGDYEKLLREFNFGITSRNLPPRLHCRSLPDYYVTEKNGVIHEKVELRLKELRVGSLINIVMVALFAFALIKLGNIETTYSIFNIKVFFENLDFWRMIILVSWVFVAIGTVIHGVLILLVTLASLFPSDKKKFKLPNKFMQEE